MPHVPPLSSPVWAPRVAELVAFLSVNEGSTFRQLYRGPWTWSGYTLRNVLAAAHPRALERDGRWYTPAGCALPTQPPPADDRKLCRRTERKGGVVATGATLRAS